MKGFHRLDMRLQPVPKVSGQDSRAVLAALASPDGDETLTEIDILDAQADALQ